MANADDEFKDQVTAALSELDAADKLDKQLAVDFPTEGRIVVANKPAIDLRYMRRLQDCIAAYQTAANALIRPLPFIMVRAFATNNKRSCHHGLIDLFVQIATISLLPPRRTLLRSESCSKAWR